MKRCPTCKQVFAEPYLSFCTEDGTPLIKIEDEADDPEATLVSPSARTNSDTFESIPSERPAGALSDWPTNRKSPGYQQSARFVQAPSPSKAWPWIIGIVALLIIGGAGVTAALLLPKMMRAASAGNENRTVNANVNQPAAKRNANARANTNSSNSNTNSATASAPPTDEGQVLADLTAIENEWQVANVEADKQRLEHILADDYVGARADGTIQGKADYIKEITPDPSIKHSEFQNLNLALKGERATLRGDVKLEVEVDGQARELSLRFIDKFVWRDARWQAVGSEVSRVE